MSEPASALQSPLSVEVPLAPATDIRLDAERLRLVCRAVVRTPIGVLPATAFIAYIMAPYAGARLAWGWMALVLLIWCGRAAISAGLLRRPPPPERIGLWIRFQIVAAMLGGLAGGAAGILFYAAPDVEFAYLTMVVCGWCAAGLAVSAAVPAAFYGFVVLFLVPLTAADWRIKLEAVRCYGSQLHKAGSNEPATSIADPAFLAWIDARGIASHGRDALAVLEDQTHGLGLELVIEASARLPSVRCFGSHPGHRIRLSESVHGSGSRP